MPPSPPNPPAPGRRNVLLQALLLPFVDTLWPHEAEEARERRPPPTSTEQAPPSPPARPRRPSERPSTIAWGKLG